MRITQRIPNVSVAIIYIVFFAIAVIAGIGIGVTNDVRKVIYPVMGLSILIMIPYIVSKIGSFPLLCGLVFMYWLPLNTGLHRLSPYLTQVYPTEFGVWMLCIGILNHNAVSKSAQRNSAISRFPLSPFLLFIVGALITDFISEHHNPYGLSQIRILCFLPAFICFSCIYLIKTVKQAEQLLWIFLVSAGVFGLVFLYAPRFANTESIFYYAGEGGRISTMIKVPLMGTLNMISSNASSLFAFIVAVSFNLWLNHASLWGRLVAASVLAISGWVIIQAQGRGGLVGAGCSVAVIGVLTLIFRKHCWSLFSKGLLKVGITVALLFGSVWYYASISTMKGFQVHGMTMFTDPLHAHGLADRIYLWKTALHEFSRHLLGVGIFGTPGSTWYAHNLILFLLLSFGIIGFIGFFWIFVRYTKACWSGLHSDNATRQILCIGGLGIVATLLVAGIFSPIMWDPWNVTMVWIPVGITLAAATLPERDRRTEGTPVEHPGRDPVQLGREDRR